MALGTQTHRDLGHDLTILLHECRDGRRLRLLAHRCSALLEKCLQRRIRGGHRGHREQEERQQSAS
jgi:hypothetical protein